MRFTFRKARNFASSKEKRLSNLISKDRLVKVLVIRYISQLGIRIR